MKTLIDACKEYFADGGSEAVRAISEIDRFVSDQVSVRVDFVDESVSDWMLTLDEDGTVLDGYCFNEVM